MDFVYQYLLFKIKKRPLMVHLSKAHCIYQVDLKQCWLKKKYKIYIHYRFGSDKLKKEYLAPSISGDLVACLGVSEVSSGSDVASKFNFAKVCYDCKVLRIWYFRFGHFYRK